METIIKEFVHDMEQSEEDYCRETIDTSSTYFSNHYEYSEYANFKYGKDNTTNNIENKHSN